MNNNDFIPRYVHASRRRRELTWLFICLYEQLFDFNWGFFTHILTSLALIAFANLDIPVCCVVNAANVEPLCSGGTMEAAGTEQLRVCFPHI